MTFKTKTSLMAAAALTAMMLAACGGDDDGGEVPVPTAPQAALSRMTCPPRPKPRQRPAAACPRRRPSRRWTLARWRKPSLMRC